MIKSVLEKTFRKVMLDYLVDNRDLVLEPDLVKGRVNSIIEDWTRKCTVKSSVFSCWQEQFSPFNYVNNGVFSSVIKQIDFDEFSLVVKDFPDGKAAGLSDISNEMWKHYNEFVLVLLLHLLNLCLVCESVLDVWKKAWVSMILKLYEWEEVLTNTKSIVLIKTSMKIFSKILSDCILKACSTHNVLHKDNFSVLKGTSTQSPIFVIGFVVENALEKGRELWLGSLERIKMCEKFVRFYGSIHNGHMNRVMTDFGLFKSYKVHDSLNQGEVFSSLLWRIFYDSLLCKVKKHESFFEYWINSKFVARTGKIELNAGLTSYLAASAFMDDTIWVGNCYTITQNILNIASEFFELMNILINMEKTVTILINSRTSNISLELSESPISITKTDFVKSSGLVKSSSPAFESSSKLDVSNMNHFGFIHSSLKNASLPVILVYTDGSVKGFGTSDTVEGAATYFFDLSLHISVEVHGLLSSILTEIQAVTLALKCILAFSNVIVFSDSQTFLDACQAELRLVAPNFCNKCWIECHHISNLVKCKNISVTWTKVKGHFGVLDNKHTNWLANLVMSSRLVLPANVKEKILMVDSKLISGNVHHFIRKTNNTIRCFQWKFGPDLSIVDPSWVGDINWVCTVLVLDGVAQLLGIERGYVTNFGLSIGHLFFSNATGKVTVNIVVQCSLDLLSG
ncbi:hypothetical protein G9A89_015515 [Geosiphon pyriformis]|nr:hypothetical protein G9A89_015515 [Geosiphon pyriformis]